MKNVERFCSFLGSYIAPPPPLPSRACRDTALTSHFFNTAEDLNCFDGKPRNFRITESRGVKEVFSSLAVGGMPKYGIWYQTLNSNRDSDPI